MTKENKFGDKESQSQAKTTREKLRKLTCTLYFLTATNTAFACSMCTLDNYMCL